MFVVEWTLRREEDKSQKVSLHCFREMNGEIGGRERERRGEITLFTSICRKENYFFVEEMVYGWMLILGDDSSSFPLFVFKQPTVR